MCLIGLTFQETYLVELSNLQFVGLRKKVREKFEKKEIKRKYLC